jgi:hypothetical protein
MRVLVWATTFGADLWSFTRYLDQQPGIEVKVVMKKPARFLEEPSCDGGARRIGLSPRHHRVRQ